MYPSSEFIFSVYENGRRYIVCLERKVCCCGRFQLDEIPCSHAIAVLKKKNVTNMNPYWSDYYKPDALAKTYEIPMVPMPDKEDRSDPKHVVAETVHPPRYRRSSGRPRKRRRKNADEKISVNTNCCGQCGQEGHNRRTCTFYPKEKWISRNVSMISRIIYNVNILLNFSFHYNCKLNTLCLDK